MIHTLLNLTRPLFVIDTETTGVDPKTDRIVELGFQQWTSEGMIKEWRTLINPLIKIPSGASKVHGIYDDDVRDALTFKQLSANLVKGFSDCDFAGKNVRFDLRILSAEMTRVGQQWTYVGARVIDIDRLEHLAVPRDLGSLHERYLGAKHEGAHGALSDVRAATAVLVKQFETHASLPRDLDLLHAKQWPGMIDMDGKFRFIDGVACFSGWGKYANKPIKSADTGYFDFILKNDFSPDVKAIASAAKLGKFPVPGEGATR